MLRRDNHGKEKRNQIERNQPDLSENVGCSLGFAVDFHQQCKTETEMSELRSKSLVHLAEICYYRNVLYLSLFEDAAPSHGTYTSDFLRPN